MLIIKRYYIISIALFLVLCSCGSLKRDNQISRIRVSFKMPIEVFEKKGYGDTINFYISYFKNYAVFELPHHETLQDDKKLLYDSVKFEYFIFNNNKKFGFMLKNMSDSFLKKENVDSVLKLRAYSGGNGALLNFIDKEIISIEKVKHLNNKEIYKYIAYNTDVADSMYIVCDSSLKDVKFSWSKHVDSLYNSKFCEFIVFLNKDSIIKANPSLAAKGFFTNRYELARDSAFNKEDMRKLFLRYIKEEKNF